MSDLQAKLELKKQQLLIKAKNKNKRYAYCIYLNNELYSRFQTAGKRLEHLRTSFFSIASYQKEVRLLYLRDPPERIEPIPDNVKKLISKMNYNEADL